MSGYIRCYNHGSIGEYAGVLKSPITHSTKAEERLQEVLDAGERVEHDELRAVTLWSVERDIEVSEEWRPAPLLRGNVWIYYSPYIENDETDEDELNEDELDEHEGVVIGEMLLYRFHRNRSATRIGDEIDQNLYDAARAMHAVTEDKESVYYDLDAIGNHRYLLDDFDLLPKYQKKRLGYLALHKGLQSAGCESNPVFVLPSKLEEDAGWEFLKRFYERMDMTASYLEEFNCVVIPNYNIEDGVMEMRNQPPYGFDEGWVEVEDDEEEE